MSNQVTKLRPQDYCSLSTLLLWGLPSQLRSLSDFSLCFLSFSSHLQVAGGQGFCDSACVSDLNDLLVMKGQEWGEICVIPSQIPDFCLCKDF